MGDVTAQGQAERLIEPALAEANRLMVAALEILDREREHSAAARLDSAIVALGLRPEGEGMPADEDGR